MHVTDYFRVPAQVPADVPKKLPRIYPPQMPIQRFPRLRHLHIRSFSSSPNSRALNAKALPLAEKISAEWKGTNATGGTTKNFIGGEFVESKASQWFDVLDPVRIVFSSYE